MPLLIEGAPGVGKSSLATATAKMLGLPLIRVQFFEGLTYDKILYDYDYQKQLLTIEAIKSSLEDNLKGKSIQEAITAASGYDFYVTARQRYCGSRHRRFFKEKRSAAANVRKNEDYETIPCGFKI